MDSIDAIATLDTTESIGKKDYTDLIQEIDSHQDVESLEVYSTDSIPEIDSHLEVEAASVHQLEEFEKEVSIFSLEPSLRVNQCQSMLLQNSSLQPLVDESCSDQICGGLSAPKLEEAYILHVDMREELTQQAVEGVIFVAHHLYDQLLLRVGGKMKQRMYQKSWMFKHRIELSLKFRLCTDQHGSRGSKKKMDLEMKTFGSRLIHKVKQPKVAPFEKEAHQEMVTMMHREDTEVFQILITGRQKPAVVNTQSEYQKDWTFKYKLSDSWRSLHRNEQHEVGGRRMSGISGQNLDKAE